MGMAASRVAPGPPIARLERHGGPVLRRGFGDPVQVVVGDAPGICQPPRAARHSPRARTRQAGNPAPPCRGRYRSGRPRIHAAGTCHRPIPRPGPSAWTKSPGTPSKGLRHHAVAAHPQGNPPCRRLHQFTLDVQVVTDSRMQHTVYVTDGNACVGHDDLDIGRPGGLRFQRRIAAARGVAQPRQFVPAGRRPRPAR